MSRLEHQRIIDVCEAVGTETARYRMMGTVLQFLEVPILLNVLPKLARLELS